MPLKNSTSRSQNTFDKIQRVLAENGAKKIMYDYSSDGKLESISFAIELKGKPIGFRLPANIDKVVEIMYGGKDHWGQTKKPSDAQREQAYKTGWANIRDWIDAQLALVKTQQVEIAQVFLPYMVTKNGKTLYDQVVTDPSFLLGSGE